ncbi:MAG: ATP-grasp domain-containing protein [Candidatus Latescibacterota bacterium]
MSRPGRVRHLLFIHTAGDPRPYVSRLRELGFRSSLIKKRPTAEDRACFARVVDLDYQESLVRALDCAAQLHVRDPVDGVLSFSESGVIAASMVAAHLGLPGNPPRAALRARNKYLMRQALREAGLVCPPFHLVRGAGEVSRILERAGRPMVLKPISGSSSYGVVRLDPGEPAGQIAAHMDAVRRYIVTYAEENPQYPFEFWLPEAGHGIPPEDVYRPDEVFLLEGFIPGQQVSVDGVVCGQDVSCLGAIEIERIRDTDYFLEYEEWMPTRLGREREAQIHAVVRRAVQALGLTCSCFHCELKVSAQEIAVLEIAARRGADNISDFLRRLLGVDIYAEGARVACGERRSHHGLPYRGGMKMRYFIPPRSGILRGTQGLEEVRTDPRVCEVDLEFSPGDRVLTPPDGFEFLGYVSVIGSTLGEAEAALEEVYPRVRFEIDPEPQAAADRQQAVEAYAP